MRLYGILGKGTAEMEKCVSWLQRWFPWLSPRNDLKVKARPAAQPEAQSQPVIRQAFAEWGGGFPGGKGTVTTEGGGSLKMPSSLATPLAGTPGTDPEELLAAVHAASFCMALVAELSAMEIEPRSIHTTATVTLKKQAQGLDPVQLHLDVSAWIPGADRFVFERAVDNAKNFWQRRLPYKGKLTTRVILNAW